MRIAVVDASVAVKWVTDEDDADPAAWLLGHAEALIAPAHWLGEAANALRAKCTIRGELTKAEVAARIASLVAMPVAITPRSELIHHAADIALDLRATIYDSLYRAVALATARALRDSGPPPVRTNAGPPIVPQGRCLDRGRGAVS